MTKCTCVPKGRIIKAMENLITFRIYLKQLLHNEFPIKSLIDGQTESQISLSQNFPVKGMCVPKGRITGKIEKGSLVNLITFRM